MANRFGYFVSAATASSTPFASQPGGCSTTALTPAASISAMHSSAEYDDVWRCCPEGVPLDQMWTCASTISIASPLPSAAFPSCVLRDAPRLRRDAPQDEVILVIELRKNIILRSPRSGRLEGRTAGLQPTPISSRASRTRRAP